MTIHLALFIWGLVQFTATVTFAILVANGTKMAVQHLEFTKTVFERLHPLVDPSSVDMITLTASMAFCCILFIGSYVTR